MRVDGFWAGAAVWAERLPLAELARRAGGWDSLAGLGVDGLQALGVSQRAATQWLSHPAVHTRGRALRWVDPDYPDALRQLPDAPPIVFVEGEVSALASRAVAVVGTRACTGYGTAVARDLGQQLGAAGLVVVSGLARGIDAAAHAGALSAGRTVAVLGHGLDHTAPLGHRALRDRLLRGGGAVLTTWLDGVAPQRWTFPSRNRWIAGLAERVVVVEAPHTSGAMHTVRAALAYGRDVHAVPGPLGAPASEGCLRLIADGASPVVSVRELVASLGAGPASPAGEPWLELVIAGGGLDAAARVRGGSVAELLGELHLREARGELVRLPGQRYAKA